MLDHLKLINNFDMIKKVKEIDFEKILQIERELFVNPMTPIELTSFFSQDCFQIWKIEIDEVVGYVSFFKVKDEVEVIKIGIAKLYQGRGYGSCLLNQIKQLSIKKLFLEVSVENIGAINFYLKNGFHKTGERKGYYKRKNNSKIDAFRLSLEL